MWVICESPASLGVYAHACSVIYIFTRLVYFFCDEGILHPYSLHSSPTTYLCRSVTVFAVKTLTRVWVFRSSKVTGLLRSSFHQGLTFSHLQVEFSGSESKHLQEVIPLSFSVKSIRSFRCIRSVNFRFGVLSIFNWVIAISVLSFQWGLFVNLFINFRSIIGSFQLVFSFIFVSSVTAVRYFRFL